MDDVPQAAGGAVLEQAINQPIQIPERETGS